MENNKISISGNIDPKIIEGKYIFLFEIKYFKLYPKAICMPDCAIY